MLQSQYIPQTTLDDIKQSIKNIIEKNYVSIGDISHEPKNTAKPQQTDNTIKEDDVGGRVIMIDGPYGSGKSFFIDDAIKYLSDCATQEIQTVVYNAWEHDDDENPLFSLSMEIAKITPLGEQKLLEMILKIANDPNVQQGVLNGVLNSLDHIGIVGTWIKAMVGTPIKAVVSFLKAIYYSFKVIKDYKKGRDRFHELEQFDKKTLKTLLKKYIEGVLATGKKLVIFVDELDRCKPDFALSLLEKIKHFFNIKDVVFVLTMDRDQLLSVVKHAYGEINAEKYLEKFFDFSFDLPYTEYGFRQAIVDQYINEIVAPNLHNNSTLYDNQCKLKKRYSETFAAIAVLFNFTPREIILFCRRMIDLRIRIGTDNLHVPHKDVPQEHIHEDNRPTLCYIIVALEIKNKDLLRKLRTVQSWKDDYVGCIRSLAEMRTVLKQPTDYKNMFQNQYSRYYFERALCGIVFFIQDCYKSEVEYKKLLEQFNIEYKEYRINITEEDLKNELNVLVSHLV